MERKETTKKLHFHTSKDSGLVGLLIMSIWKCFFSSCLFCSSRTQSFGWGWLLFVLCRTGSWSGAGDRQHVSPLPLQSLHSAAQLLNASSLGTELSVEPFYPDAKRSLGLTLVSAWTFMGLCEEGLTSLPTGKGFHCLPLSLLTNIKYIQVFIIWI